MFGLLEIFLSNSLDYLTCKYEIFASVVLNSCAWEQKNLTRQRNGKRLPLANKEERKWNEVKKAQNEGVSSCHQPDTE